MSDKQEGKTQASGSDMEITTEMMNLKTAESTSSFTSVGSSASKTSTVVEKDKGGPTVTLPVDTYNKFIDIVNHLHIDPEKGLTSRKRPRASNEDNSPATKRGKPNIKEENLPEYREARNVKAKLQKYTVTQTTLEKYISHDKVIVPKAFEIKVKPIIGNDNKTFIENWNQEVQKMQRALLDLQTDFCRTMVHDLTRDSTKATTKLRGKLEGNTAELNEAEAAIETVAKRVKAAEYTKLQGRWARDIGDHESQAMGIPLQKNNKKSNGKANQKPKNKQESEKKDNNFPNRKYKKAKRRLNNNNNKNKNNDKNSDDFSHKDLKKILRVMKAMEDN